MGETCCFAICNLRTGAMIIAIFEIVRNFFYLDFLFNKKYIFLNFQIGHICSLFEKGFSLELMIIHPDQIDEKLYPRFEKNSKKNYNKIIKKLKNIKLILSTFCFVNFRDIIHGTNEHFCLVGTFLFNLFNTTVCRSFKGYYFFHINDFFIKVYY